MISKSDTGKIMTVIGAGNSGLTMAAHLALDGYTVNLWNRTEATISKIIKTKAIYVSGKIEGRARLNLATTSIEEAVENADFIFITLPANTHGEIASRISDYIKPGAIVLLSPGRTFGAIEFLNRLKDENCKNIPLIAETQTIIYTCRKFAENSVKLLDFKKSNLLVAINCESSEDFIEMLPEVIRKFHIPAKSMIETSIGNVGMILHCAPILLNTGWIENKKYKFLYYYSGITPSIAGFLEKLDTERTEVANKLGFQIPSITQWLNFSYGVGGKNLFDALQQVESYKTIDAPLSLDHRYIYEDINTGLVPLEAVGKHLGMDMKLTSLVIDLACEIVNVNFRETGRNAEKLKINDEFFKLLKK